MSFTVRWPDGTARSYYSPSLVVREYFTVGESYALADFLARSRESLAIASARVEEKYGFPCVRAESSLAQIEEHARAFADAQVRIESLGA
jgi:uncharacterized repeat protein (TIGR04042 family)